MRKYFFIPCLSLLASLCLNAQTNTFPASGNVGLGTTSPYSKLHVFNSTNQDGLIIENSSSSMTKYGLTVNNTSTTNGYLLRLRSSAVDKMIVTGNGNVGIGIATPSTKLQVEGRTSVGISGVLNLDWTYESNWGGSANKWSGYVGFNAYRNNDDVKDNYYGNNKYTSKGVFEGSNYGFRWLFRKVENNDSDGQHLLTEYMRLDNNGKLGIGTSSPDSKLTVKGNIHTNEVKVDLLGAVAPDYVFENDYYLKPLKEVENYITKEKHLPNIPSAKDMETDGIFLKEFNLKLLEKIEELTLYTIQQEKRIENLEQENDAFRKQNERIKTLEEKIALLLKNNN